jgi:hypothetical protein
MAYPASQGWTLQALLRGPASIDITGTPSGDSHILAASAAATAAWAPGAYAYTIRATLAGEVQAVETGVITIQPDTAKLAPGGEVRSHARITLDNIKAVIEKRASQDQQRYSINNRELWRTPIADLLKLRAVYAAKVAQENNAARGRSIYGRSVGVRFTTPS